MTHSAHIIFRRFLNFHCTYLNVPFQKKIQEKEKVYPAVIHSNI